MVAGQRTGGQFKEHERAAAAPPGLTQAADSPTLPDDLVARLNDGYDERDDLQTLRTFLNSNFDDLGIDYDLVYVDYDESLSNRMIGMYLRGEQSDIYAEQLDELYYEQRQDAAANRAQELAEQLELEWEELTQEAQDVMSDHIFENDTSEPLPALVRNTHPQLMRAPIKSNVTAGLGDWAESAGVDRDKLLSGHHEDAAELRAKYIAEQLKLAGFDPDTMTDEDRDEIMSLATEGPYDWHEGVTLDVIWYGDIADGAMGNGGSPRKLTFGGAPVHSRENPDGKARVVLLDRWNGSGYDVALSQPLTVTVDNRNAPRLDSDEDSGDYGWDDTAGVYKPAYSVSVRNESVVDDQEVAA